uniref:K8.1 protein n=1 Tax=Human herpesvirus 8 TaxID=37296 RepID=A0A5B9GDH4_HHV8|nr:K8.1 protein [Human gammaherpesvirus 8]
MSSTQIRTEIHVAILILCLCLVACHAICPTYHSHLGFWQEGWSGQVYQDWLGRMNCSYENMTALEAVSLNGTRLAAGSPSSEYPNVSVSVEDTSASGSGEDAIDESGSGEEERPMTSHVTFMTQSVQATTELTDALISAFSGSYSSGEPSRTTRVRVSPVAENGRNSGASNRVPFSATTTTTRGRDAHYNAEIRTHLYILWAVGLLLGLVLILYLCVPRCRRKKPYIV